MRCPFCGSMESKVIDTRVTMGGDGIRRRRECLDCSARFNSLEVVESDRLQVVKKDERREPFDRGKIISGISIALEKRSVNQEKIEAIAMEIEQSLRRSGRKEVPVGEIGETVLDHLYKLDHVGYVRFASVYKEFKDLHEFMSELKTLVQLQQAKNS